MIIGIILPLMVSFGVNNSKRKQLKNTKPKIKSFWNGQKNRSKQVDKSATIVLGKKILVVWQSRVRCPTPPPKSLGAIGEGINLYSIGREHCEC